MARISTYNLDGTISDTDKLIGTDSSNTNTKNFRIQDLKEFIYSEISGNMSIAADGTASIATSNVALGVNSGDYVASITGGVGVDSTAATSGAVTNHTLSLDLSELSTVTSISTGNNVAISSSNAGNLITVDNLFIKSPKLVSEAAVANGDYMLFLDGGATGDMKKESLSDISTLFAGAGLVSSSSIINLDLNSLSAKSSIVQGDSLIIVDSEDSNSNKKVTYAVLEDEVYSNISGDVTINSSGVSAIGTDKVKGTMLHTSAADTTTLELSSDTLSVLKVPNALTAGDGLASGGTFDGANARTFSLDLNELTGATIANGDSIPFIDATDNTTKKEELSDIVSLLAGDALAASNSVLSVGVDDSTIEINSDAIRVKANGITNTELNKTAITSQTDLGDAFADADTILLHDATASALREGTMAHLASYVNGAYDLEASLEALNASDNIIKIGHSSDKVQIIGTFQVDGVSTLTGNTTVTGSMTANGLAFPANSAGSNGQVLTKTSDGTIGFTSGSSTSVNDTSSSSHLPIVLHDGSNNLLDDDNGLTFQASTGLLKVNKLSPQTNAAGDIGSSTVAYNDLFLSNGGVIEFIQGTGNRVQLTHIDGGVDGNGDRLDGSLRLSATSKLEFNDGSQFINAPTATKLNIVANSVSSGPVGVDVQGEVQIDANLLLDINAATTDISGILIVGGNTTVGGDAVISGGDITFGNGQDATISISERSAGLDGRNLTISAGSASNSGSDPDDGGNLILKSGSSFGSGTSDILFRTAISSDGYGATTLRMTINNSGIVMAAPLDLNEAANISGNLVLGARLQFGSTTFVTEIDNSTSLGSDDNKLATQKAIKTYVDAQVDSADTLGELNDVTLTSAANHSMLLYNGSEWIDNVMSGDATMANTGVITIGTLNQSTTGSAATLTTARNFSLTGNVTASAVSFDGSGNVALSTSLAANTVDSSELVDGSIDTSHIGDDQVTYAKIQNVANDERILGRVSGANGVIEELTKSQVLTMINVADGANAYVHPNHSGDVTSSADGAQTIANNAVTYAKIQNVVSNNVLLGNDNGTNQDVQELSASDVRTMLSVDVSGTDNSTNVSLSGTPDYITISGQVITRNQIDLTADVTGVLPSANLDSDTAHLSTTQTFSGAKTFSSAVNITNTTEATSTTTGALKVAGGVGIEKDLHVEEELVVGDSIGVGVTPFANSLSSSSNIDLIGNGGILSYANNLYLTSNAYYNGGWKAKTTGTTSLLIVRSSALEYHVDTSSQSDGIATSFDQVFTVSSAGDVTANNFIVGSDRRIKSEIEPIKEGLEVIKQFTSYNYIKGGKKESGFIAQEVQEVLPHTVYEDKEGMLSMSDRGVLAHMHKAILELEKRLISIEEKLK